MTADLKVLQTLEKVLGFCTSHPNLTYGNTAKWQEETVQYLADCHEWFRKLDRIVKEA